MVSYFYKNQYKTIVSYISCQWLNEIDLDSADLTIPICQLTLTNISDFYKGVITVKNLEDFKKGEIEKDILKKVIEAGLQGEQKYKDEELKWKTVFTQDSCEMTLIGYWKNALPMQVGSFVLPQVTNNDNNNKELWQGWLEDTAKEFASLKESQMALTIRNDQLEKRYKECESMADNLAIEKQDSERTLFEKFMALLNNKKRKIRKLQEQLKKRGITIEPSTVKPDPNQSDEPIIANKKSKKSNVNIPPISASQPKPSTSSSSRSVSSASININRLEKTMPTNITNSSLSVNILQTSQPHILDQFFDDSNSDDTKEDGDGHIVKKGGNDNDNDDDDNDELQEWLDIAPKVKRKAANPKIEARKKQKQREDILNSPVSKHKYDTDDEDF